MQVRLRAARPARHRRGRGSETTGRILAQVDDLYDVVYDHRGWSCSCDEQRACTHIDHVADVFTPEFLSRLTRRKESTREP